MTILVGSKSKQEILKTTIFSIKKHRHWQITLSRKPTQQRHKTSNNETPWSQTSSNSKLFSFSVTKQALRQQDLIWLTKQKIQNTARKNHNLEEKQRKNQTYTVGEDDVIGAVGLHENGLDRRVKNVQEKWEKSFFFNVFAGYRLWILLSPSSPVVFFNISNL